MSRAIVALEWFFLLYFVLAHAGALALNLLAIPALRRKVVLRPLEDLPAAYSGFEPPVSILVPACDEEATIARRVQALLELDYPEFEVVVVNDGSRDGTLATLVEAFGLEVFPEAHWRRLPATPVRAIYHSRLHPNLRVVDQERGGEANALNAGINASRYPLFCTIDRDLVPRRDSLRRVVEPFVDDPSTLASAGAVRLGHSRAVDGGAMEEDVALPAGPLTLLQVVEHLRTSLYAPLGWATMNAALVVPGAFVVFRKDKVVEAGGYRADATRADVELVARLHRLLRGRGERCPVHFVPDPVGRVAAPASLAALAARQIRAQRGLCESLHGNLALVRARGRGAAGLVALPFLLLFGCYGPALELAGYAFMAAMWLAGQVSGTGFLAFLALAFSLGFLVSLSGLLLEELSLRLPPRLSQVGALVAAAVLENLGYRQLVAVWRAIGLARWLRARFAARQR